MNFKRFLLQQLFLFFMLSTLITVAISLIGSFFDRDALFGYEALLSPIKYAALCLLPSFLAWSRHELSLKELILRKAIMLFLIEAEILLIAFQSPAIDTERISVVITLAGSVLVIFVLANLLLWLKTSVEASFINRDLVRYQKSHG